MQGLVLKSGGRLDKVRWVYDDEAEKGEYVATDVTEDAISYLLEPVRFEGELFLRDIFALVDLNPALLLVLRRDWGAEYLAEYKRVIATAPLYSGEYDPDGLEYLELYQSWSKNSATGEISGHQRLDFHGIGYELREDIMQDDWVMHKKGSRISWAVEMTPLAELLNLPLRLNPEVIVSEDDTESGNYMKKLETLRMSTPTLAQVVHGILWELSFCGGPEDAIEKKEHLKKLMAEVDEAIEKGDDSAFVELKPEDLQ
jgi:hypothetical protein